MILRLRYYFILLILTIFFGQSCISIKKELDRYPDYQGKTILYKQKIKGKVTTQKYILNEYLIQTPNRGFIFPSYKPYLKAYLLGKRDKILFFKPNNPTKTRKKIAKTETKYELKIKKKLPDTTKTLKIEKKRDKKIFKLNTKLQKGNWLMRTVGEQPVFYDSVITEQSQEQLSLYLKSIGYFHAKVKTETKHKKHKSIVTYQITQNKPHTITEVKYTAEDPKIQDLIDISIANSVLKEGEKYEVNALTLERERINRYLKNNGYFKFNRQYIVYKVDTIRYPFEAKIELIIKNPKKGLHTPYTINNVYFSIDGAKKGKKDTIAYKGINFIHGEGKYSKKLLFNDHKVKPGNLYSIKEAEKTQQLLGAKDIFKFININFKEVDSTKLDVYTNANSLKKYQITSEVGANVNLTEGQSLPGPFINLSFKDRKIFNGFEIFETNARYSYEQQPSLTNSEESLRAQELGLNFNLSFPKVLIPTKIKNKFNNIASKTIISAGYKQSERVEYNFQSADVSLNYKWFTNSIKNYALSPINVSVINTTDISEDFKNYLDTLESIGNNLKRSFDPGIITGINMLYLFNNNDITKNIKAKYIRLWAEGGGALASFISQNSSEITDSETGKIGNIPYYQYYKVQGDGRRYFPLTKFSSVATRLTAGIAQPIGQSSVLPYDRYFFAGGLNSVRAWALKRLGPGEYVQKDDDGENIYTFEQPGEIYLEYNLEVRSKLIGFINGAAFVDAGNVWMIHEDPARPGAKFHLDKFYKQIAVGVGAGLRLDFSFLIFRFDLGMKVWDPARKIIVPFEDKNKFVFNFGIGYPY